MAKQTNKQKRPEVLAYHQRGYVGIYIHLPVKWIITIILLIVVKLLPEWWGLLQLVLPTILK